MNKRAGKTVEALTHDEASRKNIPTAEHEPVMPNEDRSPVRVAYERRNRDLDPQLVWRGKDEQNWSDLVVQAPPLFIQEKVGDYVGKCRSGALTQGAASAGGCSALSRAG